MSQKPPPKQFVKTPINGTKVYVVSFSAKGGVGKSTVAINLAFALQKPRIKSWYIGCRCLWTFSS